MIKRPLRIQALGPAGALVCVGFALFNAELARGQTTDSPEVPQPDWGHIVWSTNWPGGLQLEVANWPANGRLPLPTPLPEIVGVHLDHGLDHQPLAWVFNTDATQLYLEVPGKAPPDLPAVITLETADSTQQQADGRIVFSSADAQVEGTQARLESHPGNHRIGFWTKPSDTVSWPYKPTRWGSYEVELAFSAEGGMGTEVRVEIAGQGLSVKRPATGSWYRYQTLDVGRVHIEKDAPLLMRVGCPKLEGLAVMNLKAVTLRPAPEGDSIVQEASGEIVLPAHGATTHSVMMRFEPAPHKNCLGYWVNPGDWANWEFTVTRPGLFSIELWQGCGKGQGGSEVALDVAGERFTFQVEETGHFQSFLPRHIGQINLRQAGRYQVALRPLRKQASAIMDVRQVRLIPAAEPASAFPSFPGRRSLWFGFERYDFEVGGRGVLVVSPKKVAPGRPWVWEGEFFGHKPEPDLALLGRGFHVAYMNAPDMFGCPGAIELWNAFYRELTRKYGLSDKPALVGLSRGGLYVYNWAEANPDHVACIYGDAPVCDFKSWPGGKGKGPGSAEDWQLLLERFHFTTEAEAEAYNGNPVDNLAPLAAAKVPLLHVYGDADEIVPWEENTGLVSERYHQLGGAITLIAKPGGKHHPHGLDDSTPIIKFLWDHTATQAAKDWLERHGGGPLDAQEHPLIRKLGTVDLDLVETTPVVFQGRLYRFEWVRDGYWNNKRKTNYFRFIDLETGESSAPFADGNEFGSAYVEGSTVYVTGTEGRDHVNLWTSTNLTNWTATLVIPPSRYGIFNTSLWKTGDDYTLMFEIDHPVEEAGVPFTARFIRSRDLRTWTMTPTECNYSKDRYSAPHCLRWLDGWYYDFFLEAHDGYEVRVVRSRDLIHWEMSPMNPVLKASAEDKLIANPKLDDGQRARIANAVNLNNSDIDFCEWRGRLMIDYSWGNQQGVEHLAQGVYDGSMAEFLRGWFPAK